MRSLRRTLSLGAALLGACSLERLPPADDQNLSRSESVSISLPTNPEALARALSVPQDSLRAAAEERYGRQSFDSAQAIFRVELVRAQNAHDSAAEARTRMWLGMAAWKLGDYRTSRREGEASLGMKRKLGLDAELSRSFNALGLLAWHEGRYHDALTNFDSAMSAAKRNSDTVGIARTLGNIPLVQVELGDFDNARRGFNATLALGQKVADDRIQGNALANLAMLEIRLGNPTSAFPLLSRAREHYATIEYSPGESNALGQLSTAWSQLGDLQRAIAAADSGLAIARSEGLQQEVAATLEVIADLQMQAGNPRLALRLLSQADSLDTNLGLALEHGTNLRRLSAILAELGEAPASVARAREALAAHRKVEARGEVVYDRLQLARSLALSGNTRAGQTEADSALREAAEIDNPAALRDAAGIAARLAIDARDPKLAVDLLGSAERSSPTVDWRLADLHAEALFALGRPAEARQYAERSVAALERERASLGLGPLRSGYLASRAAPFSHLVAIDLKLGDTASAFRVAASLPGRSLTERLGGLGEASTSVALVAERETQLMRIAALERELAKAEMENEQEKQRTLARALESARSRYEDQLDRQAALPEAKRPGSASVTLANVHAQLGSDEALLLFLSGPDHLDVFVLRTSLVHHERIALGDRALTMRVRFLRELMTRSSPASGVPNALGDLYTTLLGSATTSTALNGVSHLLIVPHGSLGALPFPALWNASKGRFLVEEYSLRYLPSVALLRATAGVRNTTSRLSVFAPLPDSLPGTKREALAVGRFFPGADTRMGKRATEAGVRVALGTGRSVHIASHGTHNAQNPLFSRLIVGQRRGNSSSDDGRLDVHEILGLSTTSPLVFLSGCETALGSAGQGAFAEGSEEGSLSQAFLIAGAGDVVATLWRVDDAGAVRIAESFYRHLKSGVAPEEALTLSQREAISRSRGYTWAGYTISGRGSAAESRRLRSP